MEARSRERVGDRFRIEVSAASSKAQTFRKVPVTREGRQKGGEGQRTRREKEALGGGRPDW